jgi:hypothetical protein
MGLSHISYIILHVTRLIRSATGKVTKLSTFIYIYLHTKYTHLYQFENAIAVEWVDIKNAQCRRISELP